MSSCIDLLVHGAWLDLVCQVEVRGQVLELTRVVCCEAHAASGRQEDELPRKCCNAARHAQAASKARSDAQAASNARGGTHALLERKLLLLGAAHAAAATQEAAAMVVTSQQRSIACGPGKASKANMANKCSAKAEGKMQGALLSAKQSGICSDS
eukprot:3423998-Amphidinium_carterae.1